MYLSAIYNFTNFRNKVGNSRQNTEIGYQVLEKTAKVIAVPT